MRVLVTGASGFLGRYVLDALLRRNIETIVVRRQLPLPAEEGQHSYQRARFIETDLLATPDLNALLSEARATHLLHLAWYAEHGKYWTSPLNLRWVDASVRLVEAFCDAGGRRVVVAGTCAEYDWSQPCCDEQRTPLAPATLYGAAKDATRRLVTTLCAQREIGCAWARIFLPFGSGEHRARLIPSLLDVLHDRRAPIAINAHAARDFLHASDVATAFVALLNSDENGAYNICSGQAVELTDIVRMLARLMGRDPQPLLDPATVRADEPAVLYGDNRKLKGLGWEPALTLEQGLERSIREWRP